MNTHRRITTLGELVTSRAGKTPLTTNPAFWEGSVPWVTAKDLKQFRVKDSIDRITGAAVDDGAPMAVAGDVLILVRGMTLLKDVPIAICESPVSFNQDVRCLSTKPGVDSEYLALFLEASKGRIRNFISVAGHGTGRLDSEALMTLPIALLGKNSEARVARHFRAVERAIQLTDALIAAKREQKRGLMQQLLTGKVRFPGFTEPWKSVKLGDVVEFERGVSYSRERDLRKVGDQGIVRLLRATNIQDGALNFDDVHVIDAHCAKSSDFLETGDIAICIANGSKSLVGKFAVASSAVEHSPTVVGAFCARARVRESFDPMFVAAFMESRFYRRWINALLAGTNINNLKPSDIASAPLALPSEAPEINCIVGVYANLRAEIDALCTQRSLLVTKRRGLMERLLSGDIAIASAA